MKKEKILINIENLNDIDKYKKIGINNFLFAVENFSIGYKSFELDTIKKLEGNKFLLINRVLNCEDINILKKIKNKILVFDGIVFEDIGVYNIFKDEDIKLIWNQAHFGTNYSSINHWMNLVYSAIVSNELTKDEINEIINKSSKDIILNVFGKNPVMYSRRKLLTNYNINFNLKESNNITLKEPITNNEFDLIESNLGTILFNKEHFNIIPYINQFDNNKILYYLIYPDGLNYDQLVQYLNGKMDNTNDGFLNRKTIYKLGVRK